MEDTAERWLSTFLVPSAPLQGQSCGVIRTTLTDTVLSTGLTVLHQ